MAKSFYTLGSLNIFMSEEQQQCIFCHIASGNVPAKKVFEDDKVVAVLDINPATAGHLLLVTKDHVAIMPQMDDSLIGHVGMVSKQLSHALIRALKVEGTSIFVANGVVAGQRAPHFMLHVIPRSADDGVGLQWPLAKLDDKVMKQVYDLLVVSVSKQFGVEPPKSAVAEKKKDKGQTEKKSEQPEKKQENQSKKSEAKKESKADLDDIAKLLTGGK